MNLDELTSWLFRRTSGGIKWGLDTTRALLAGGGDPHRRFQSLHIGGTNGKGSVAALCDAVLRQRGGGPIGLYTSPHLVEFTERIRVDGVPVSAERLLAAARRLEPLIEETGASFFEATTAMAFLCFAEAGVETAVVEVGLGGRLDATNVLEPLVSVVTNVALDHTAELGDTLDAVAAEKAGIFKAGVPAIVGERGAGPLRVLRERAREVGAPFHTLAERASISGVEMDLMGTRFVLDSRYWGRRRLRIPLVGVHQVANAALAAEALALLPEGRRPGWAEVEAGFAEVRWPGRFQVESAGGVTWIFDVAHNPAGVEGLVATLDVLDIPRPLVVVAAILADKRWDRMLPPLVGRADSMILTTAPTAPASRRWDPQATADWLIGEAGARTRVVLPLAEALDRARGEAAGGTVLVTGSVHTVGDALALLRFPTR